MRFDHADLCTRKTKQATSKFDLAIELRDRDAPSFYLFDPFKVFSWATAGPNVEDKPRQAHLMIAFTD
jgi:hypothetical protein